MRNSISFSIGLKSNEETNEFLRCLWSRIASSFGKLAWQYSPMRIGNTIHVGDADIGKKDSVKVTIHYKQRGCISSIEFFPNYDYDEDEKAKLENQLKQCVNEALRFDMFKRDYCLQGFFDKNISFKIKKGDLFSIEGNTVILKVWGYDEEDIEANFKAQLLRVCDFLTFDTLRYITISDTLTEEIRESHNYTISLINQLTGKVEDKVEKNKMYRGLEVSEKMAKYIDAYLARPYKYEANYTLFDTSVQMFAQGVRNEELSDISVGWPDPYAEMSIVNYMSALEVITLNDIKPKKCECCGQMIYSIARRVINLAESVAEVLGGFVKDYYGERSEYVHTGVLRSSYNYGGKSIPLMSTRKNSRTGMIAQLSIVPADLKEMVKTCIEWHETNFVESGCL